MTCRVCSSNNVIQLNTYKHYWHACQDCLSLEREKKTSYALERIFPKRLKGKLPGYFTYILPGSYFDESKLGTSYNYYADMGNSNKGSATKWAGETQVVADRLKHYGIDLSGKSVLDVSGGPGFVANDLSSVTQHILLTEFSETAVAGMRKFLSIDVEKYDYNSDDLDKVTNKKFDVILVRFSINFALDLSKFAREAKRLLNRDGVLYIEHVEPNAGCILRWEFDEYTYNVLYGIPVFTKLIEKEGFALTKQEVLFTEPFNKPYWNYSSLKTRMFYFVVHRIRGIYKMMLKGNISRELKQISWVSIFKNK